MLIVGGSGPIVDIANNDRVHDLILGFSEARQADRRRVLRRDRAWRSRATCRDRKSIISGKHVTGHCKEYDYKDGTGFIGVTTSTWARRRTRSSTSCATRSGRKASTIGNVGHATSVIVDYPFITGRSTPDSYLTGEKIVEVLEQGLRRYGW